MPSIWPFSGPTSSSTSQASASRRPDSARDVAHRPSTSSSSSSSSSARKRTNSSDASAAAAAAAATTIPPLIICEGFLSAAQSVVWGNEFRTYLGVGHQQLVDQIPHHNPTTSSSPASVSTSIASSARNGNGAEEGGRRRKRRSGLGSARTVVFAPIGPVSSLHDRACELFYALRGGSVDYGEQHSKEHGHARYGRHYDQPLCPTWGPYLPAHFLGHSLGGPTILKLQQLLRQGFFNHALGLPPPSSEEQQGGQKETEEGVKGRRSGWRPEDLILSITSVSSPFRGTPLVYSLGSEPLPYPKVRMFSFGDLLSKFIHIAAFLDLPFFDAHADAWHFSAKHQRRQRQRRKSILPRTSSIVGGVSIAADPESGTTAMEQDGEEEDSSQSKVAAGTREFLRQLWKSDWAGGRDCAPWDCTFAERDLDRQEHGWGLDQQPEKRQGKTWYRSYAGGMTMPDTSPDSPMQEVGFHRPETYWSLSPLTFTSHLIGHFDYESLQPIPSFLRSLQPHESTDAEKSPGAAEKGKKRARGKGLLENLSSTWWENDGVVPLASQFHPFDCHPERCRHFTTGGMSASLPFGQRRKRPQSTLLLPTEKLESSPMLMPSPVSETATLVDVQQDGEERDVGAVEGMLHAKMEAEGISTGDDGREKEEGGRNMPLLPLPATTPTKSSTLSSQQRGRSSANRSILGSAKSAAKIAYFTSLRAINLHDPPLVTPSDEELKSFLPLSDPFTTTPFTDTHPPSSASASPTSLHPTPQPDPPKQLLEELTPQLEETSESKGELEEEMTATTRKGVDAVEEDLLAPQHNKWYTFQIPNLDHTSLCPFWTGSEVQKQFWTGLGFFLASVDRLSEYTVVEE